MKKLIVATIGEERLTAVRAALREGGHRLASVTKIEGGESSEGPAGTYRGIEFRIPRHKLRLEVVADAWCADAAIEAILRAASARDSTSSSGCDVFVTEMEECLLATEKRDRSAVAV